MGGDEMVVVVRWWCNFGDEVVVLIRGVGGEMSGYKPPSPFSPGHPRFHFRHKSWVHTCA